MKSKVIRTGLGDFSKEKFESLVKVRDVALTGIRQELRSQEYIEVTTSSLVNIAGSCENPNASFKLDYYGREAHLSQSAQIQLEALVMRLRNGFFTVNNSFREEHYDDPEAKGRRLSEFTLIEPEKPYESIGYEQALDKLIEGQTKVIRETIKRVITECPKDIVVLGGDLSYLRRTAVSEFPRITYDEVLKLLSQNDKKYEFGADFGIVEERSILNYFGNIPTFVTHYPSSIKFFNMKKMPDGERVYSVDLLMPKLGETTGGALREESGELIKRQLRESKIGKYLSERGENVEVPFTEYFSLFEQEEPMLRGGYGIGFERFVGFLLGSNDILDTIAYRTLAPN